MIDQYLIERKLRRIEGFLREIVSADAPKDFEDFSKNIVFKRFIERNIELAIEQMIDVCKHFISALDLQEPETYAECFRILGENGILGKETMGIFQSMARYRNLLIHGYDGIDDTVTYGIYKERLGDFRIFIESVRGYLCKMVS
jgi:uncharacterized protein YutE (UPF0331/DUF86 family)